MKTTDLPDEAEALAKLREHERELDRRLELARQEAAALVGEARQAAEALSAQAETELHEEVEHLREEASRILERALADTRDETGRRIEALDRQGERNQEQAVAWLLSRVTGRDTP